MNLFNFRFKPRKLIKLPLFIIGVLLLNVVKIFYDSPEQQAQKFDTNLHKVYKTKIANADAPYSQSTYYSQSGYGGGDGGDMGDSDGSGGDGSPDGGPSPSPSPSPNPSPGGVCCSQK